MKLKYQLKFTVGTPWDHSGEVEGDTRTEVITKFLLWVHDNLQNSHSESDRNYADTFLECFFMFITPAMNPRLPSGWSGHMESLNPEDGTGSTFTASERIQN